MRRARFETTARCVLLAAVLVLPTPAGADVAEPAATLPLEADDSERQLREEISRIESRDGAYSADLPEQMLSLGLSLQRQQRHTEALALFKRGVHLSRVNNGLYCAEQIPLLQGEIKSAIALGEYSHVDELQEYLFRVQQRGMDSGEQRANALMQQASWQFDAYRLGLGDEGASRLVTMWDLYRMAWSDLAEVEGDTSPKLLAPLYGLLRTQYLIAEYRVENEPPGSSFNSGNFSPDANRFYAYRSENYELGRSVIISIYNIQKANRGEASPETLDAIVALGDWAQWHGKRDDATEIYRHVLAELAQPEAAQMKSAPQFAEPVPLPDIKGLHRLPAPVNTDEGNILVEFGVDSRGSVIDLERLDTNEDLDTEAKRLMRALRDTKFRPRFEAGQPVETDRLVRAYDIESK